jgi:hypothetical protein
MPHQRERRDVRLRLRHQINRQIPGRQWQTATFHDGARAQARLMIAGFTLSLAITATSELVRQCMRASGTFEAMLPARIHQRGFALSRRPVFIHELHQRQFFLKLNFIDSHDHIPRRSIDCRWTKNETTSSEVRT